MITDNPTLTTHAHGHTTTYTSFSHILTWLSSIKFSWTYFVESPKNPQWHENEGKGGGTFHLYHVCLVERGHLYSSGRESDRSSGDLHLFVSQLDCTPSREVASVTVDGLDLSLVVSIRLSVSE
jgi:hypothetical protein